MPVTINVNGLSLVHQGSGAIAIATLPDVCKTPIIVPVPLPYPNIADSSTMVKGSTTVLVDGGMPAAVMGTEFASSSGDQAGVLGGVVSNTIMMEAKFVSSSFNVFIEGKGACRLTDKMVMNKMNTACLGGVIQPPVAGAGAMTANTTIMAQKTVTKDNSRSERTKNDWLGIRMVDEDGQGIDSILYHLAQKGQIIDTGYLIKNGLCLKGLAKGAYEITFPDLDKTIWTDEKKSPSATGRWFEVSQSDCLSTIAAKEGLFWLDIWNHNNNRELREERGNPNILKSQDRLFIPDKEQYYKSCETGKCHTFTHKGVPFKIRVRLVYGNETLSNVRYIARYDDDTKSKGFVDSDGCIELSFDSLVREAEIWLFMPSRTIKFPVLIGRLDPTDSTSGVQQRLSNLGYVCQITGRPDKETGQSLLAFQTDNGIEPTGIIDQATRQALAQKHGG
jgi:hypothetical protein